MAEKSLVDELADALPNQSPFTIYHISTPPEPCEPIYRPLPGKNPDKTFCESHFLNVAITLGASNGSNTERQPEELLIMAIECLIYTTKRLTTIFVSKADSTGNLHFLNLPPRSYDSPLRVIATTFISHLARHRTRPGVPCVIDLFARASNQYLFPRSVKNPTKHVSDDRQLVRWWLRVLDPVLQEYAPVKPQGGLFTQKTTTSESAEGQPTAQAYLLVPGEESITSFLPQNVRFDASRRSRWTHGHPLQQLNGANAPPRCLIPIFPDDPKGRFCEELDGELPDGASSADGSPTKRGTGIWNSARTLEQFWDLMAFRAECSSGRLVGFIWLVIQKPDKEHRRAAEAEIQGQNSKPASTEDVSADSSFTSTSSVSQQPANLSTPRPKSRISHKHNRSNRKERQPRVVLSGPITPRLPRIKTAAPALSKLRNDTKYYLYDSSRGNLILDKKSYDRAIQVLLDLDFGGREASARSTTAWIEQVSVLAGKGHDLGWGDQFVGKKAPTIASGQTGSAASQTTTNADGSTATVNVLGIKKKRKVPNSGFDDIESSVKKARPEEVAVPLQATTAPTVNVLNGGFVRKKAKLVPPSQSLNHDSHPMKSEAVSNPPPHQQPEVNTLNPSLIRKNTKRKPDHLDESSSGPDDTVKRARMFKEDSDGLEPATSGGNDSTKRKIIDEAVDRVESSMKRVKVSPSKASNGNDTTKRALKRKATELSDDEDVLAMEKETKVRLIT